MRWLFSSPLPWRAIALLSSIWGDPVPWRALLTDWQAGREHYYVLMGTDCRACCWHCLSVQPLAVAGVLIQGIVRSPLASPDILGVNHAASFGLCGGSTSYAVAAVMVLPLLAFAGGMARLILLKMLAKTRSR
ncbi:iron chelate uptake ABC transporter family permease subunit [Escherichia coli]|nr:iron chelate uptake ABC transporter family permease subunit [Escherichia coli]